MYQCIWTKSRQNVEYKLILLISEKDNILNFEFSENNRILIVGDSFAFGDQVSNNQTLPSCIERKLKVKTDNGGVGGYGAAQSILRAKYENSKKVITYFLWFDRWILPSKKNWKIYKK